MCTIGLAAGKVIGGGLYGIGTTADLSGLETDLDAFLTSYMALVDTDFTVTQYVWHEHRASHPATPKGNELLGSAVRRTTKSIAGTNLTSRIPDQNSATITLRTGSRRHWGRVYMPGLNIGAYDMAWGRIKATTADSLAAAMRTLLLAWAARSYALGVWSWEKGAFMPCQEIRVDDVPDIQRRRRAKQASYSKSYTS